MRSSTKGIQRDLMAYRSVCDLNQQPMYSCETLRLIVLMRLIWIWMSYQGRAPSYRPKCISFSRKIRAEDYRESEIACVIQLYTKREQNHETWISRPWIMFIFQETLNFSFYMSCSKHRRARGSRDPSYLSIKLHTYHRISRSTSPWYFSEIRDYLTTRIIIDYWNLNSNSQCSQASY